MVDTPTVRSQIKSTYNWRNPDIARVAPAVSDAVVPFFGREPTFSGSLRRDGEQQISQEHKTLETWKTALSAEWDVFGIYINAGASRSARIDFSLKEHKIEVSLNTADSDTGWLTDLLEKFQKSMSLGPPQSPGFKPKEGLEGQYRVKDPRDISWFEKLLEKLEAWAGPLKYYDGDFSLGSAPHFRQSPAVYSDWKRETIANWQGILKLNAVFQNDDREFSLRYNASRGELNLTLSSYNSNELSERFQGLEKELPILPFENKVGPGSPKGEQRRYFASEPIDVTWFERASTLINSIAKVANSFQGRFRTLNGKELLNTNPEQWYHEVKSSWEEVASVYCWAYTSEITLMMQIDLLRDLVTLELQAANEEVIQQHLNAFESELKLVKTGDNPYRYRRFLRAFEIIRWTSSAEFAEALKTAVEVAFPGRVPGRRVAMTTAYVTVGDREEDLYSSLNYQSFLEKLERSENLTRAELVLEGPNGRMLSVLLDRTAKRLTISTSLDRDDVKKLTTPFRNAMELSLEEAKDEPDKEKADKPRLTWLMVVTAIFSILAALWSGAVAVFTSQRGLTAFRDQYVIEITHPVGESGKPVTVNGQEVRIEWRLTKKDLTGDHLDLRSNASVEVVPDENPRDARSYTGTGGAVVVPFTPGSYWIRVVSDVDRNSAASVKLTVPKPDDDKQPKPTKPTGGKR